MSEPVWKPPAGALKDHERVVAARKLLDGSSPEVRRAVLSLALCAELDTARSAYAKAYAAEQSYKADLIRRNAVSLQEAAERLDAQRALLLELLDLGGLLVQAAGELNTAGDVVAQAMGQLATICGPWRDAPTDLERGAGLSKYDTEDGVARVRRLAHELHERYKRRRDQTP